MTASCLRSPGAVETLPDARRLELKGQGHEGMYGDPGLFVETVTEVLEG